MEYKKILGSGLLVLFLLSLLVVPVMAGNGNGGNGNGNVKSNAELAQDRLIELQHGNGHQYGKYKSAAEKGLYKHKLVDINNEIEVYSDLDSSTIISTVEKDNRIRLKDIDSEHKLRSVRLDYSDVANAPGFENGKILITHCNVFGVPDAKWTQEVINQDGHVYFDDLPFSEIVIGGAVGVWVAEDNEYLEPTENINIGFSADPGMISFLNAYVNDFNITGSVVGFEVNNSDDNPSVRTVDVDGNTLYNYNFSKNPIWGGIRRCTIDTSTLDISYGANARGDGLDLSGASGPVMVEVPRFWVNYDNSTGNQIFWVTPYNLSDYGFEVHPDFMQRNGFESDYVYFGAYEASLKVNSTGSLVLDSRTGAQPWTGGEIDSLAFTGGITEFNAGDNVTGQTSTAYGYVVDYYVSSGSWAGNDAAGTVYLKQVNGTYQNAENLQVSAATVAVSGGVNSPISLTLDEAEGYGNNIGENFGITNVWGYSALQLLVYTEFGTRDIQTALGRGIVDLSSGAGFTGKNTGADSTDTNIGTNGTGTGTGINGETPIVWRGFENLPSGGNVWEFIAGINMYLSDGSVRILTPNGTGTPAATIADGNYITLPGTVPLTDGYISGIQTDKNGALAFTPAATVGSSSTHYADYFWYPIYSPSVVLFGGSWTDGSTAGVGCRGSYFTPSSNSRYVGARLEYIPVITENVSSPSISSPNIQFTTDTNATYSAGWDSSGDNPISIPFSSSDEAITTVYTSSDVLGLLDVNITLGYLENTTIISEELTDEYYRVYITHIPGNDYESGFVNYTSDANDILNSPFLQTNLSSNNENASHTLDTYDWSITTGPITQGTTYNYVLTAYLEGTIIDDVNRDGIGYTGLGAYEAEGNETTIIGSRFTAYSSKESEWGGNGSDIYIPVAGIILVSVIIIAVGFAIKGLSGIKED